MVRLLCFCVSLQKKKEGNIVMVDTKIKGRLYRRSAVLQFAGSDQWQEFAQVESQASHQGPKAGKCVQRTPVPAKGRHQAGRNWSSRFVESNFFFFFFSCF